MNKSSILTVSQLNFYTKSLLDENKVLSQVFVRGEISNLTNHYRSGHIYFSLKDEKSVVRCVMFSGNAGKLKFIPQDGMSVIIIGRATLYEATGQFQLYAEQMQPDGIGDLTIAFQQLKEKLEKQGLFDISHKKPIPQYPHRIGVITSSTGAVRLDIETVLKRRYPIAEMVLYPASVQGENAVPQLILGLKYFNKNKNVDTIIIGRGGGSLEDLWAFNSEQLAYEIYNSEIPVISAVGHATDVTICDFVADKQAPTPSAAAELAVPDITHLYSKIISFNNRLVNAIKYKVATEQQKADNLADKLSAMSENYQIPKLKANLVAQQTQLNNAINRIIENNHNKLNSNVAKLNVLSPLNIISRGYSITTNSNNKIIKSVNDVNINDSIQVLVNDGTLSCTVNSKGMNNNA